MSASPAILPLSRAPSTAVASFRLAMRQLASGVSVITHGAGDHRTGFSATSVSSLSDDPPTLIVCVNRSASLYAQLRAGDLFGVSVFNAQHTEIADRFAGRAGVAGAKRFLQGRWTNTPDGVSLLADAIAVFECEAEDVIERHSHAILIGRVRLASPKPAGGALLYWRGVLAPQVAPARGVGEYGSVIFIAGNTAYVSEIAPLLIIVKLEEYDYDGAAAVAAIMLAVSFVMLFIINATQSWSRRRLGHD